MSELKLTRKCLKDFEKWVQDKHSYHWVEFVDELNTLFQNALYLEFFDLRGIYIDRNVYERKINIWNYREEEPSDPIVIDCEYLESFKDWYEEAIEKANELYNSSHD